MMFELKILKKILLINSTFLLKLLEKIAKRFIRQRKIFLLMKV